MAKVPVSYTTNERDYAGLPVVVVQNRFFESNPTQKDGVAMLARPGTDVLWEGGDGACRGQYSLSDLFGSALFSVMGNVLYRRNTDGTVITIGGYVFGDGAVSMTGDTGADYERLWIADGSHLQFYSGGTHASGTLTGTGQVSEGDTLRIGSTWYEWTATVANGSGTMADPWLVLIGADLEESLANMAGAISFVGTPGTTWSANLSGQNAEVTAVSDATTMDVTARTDLAAGNSLATTVTSADTVPNVSWGASTLTGGGVHGLSGCEMPDGLPPVSVGTLKHYIIVAVGGTDRFFWVRPGAVVIDPLDFATAESQPDDVLSVEIVGDTAWFIGRGSTEVWYPVVDDDPDATPFAPVSGRVYDRGAIEGTIVNIKGTIFLVGPDYIVYAIGGSAQRVSNHGVEQQIREALA